MNRKIFRRAVGRRIASLRRERGLKREQLADLLKIPGSRLAKWECGSSAPPLEDLVALSEALSVTADELLTGRLLPPLPKELSAEMRAQLAAHLTAVIELLN